MPKRIANEVPIKRQMVDGRSARPSSDLIQQALDWLFEQPEALAYDQTEAAQRQAAPGRPDVQRGVSQG